MKPYLYIPEHTDGVGKCVQMIEPIFSGDIARVAKADVPPASAPLDFTLSAAV